MRELLIDRAVNGPRAFAREAFDYDAFFDRGEHLRFEHLAVGGQTASDMKGRVKYVDHPVFPVPPADLGRVYLAHCFEEQSNKRRVGFNRRSAGLLGLRPPQLYRGPVQDRELAYLDVKSAYFQLFGPETLDLRFDPHNADIGRGRIRFLGREWLEESPDIRHAVGGIIISRWSSGFRRGQDYEEVTHNRYLAPELWGYLMVSLHYMAYELDRRFAGRMHYWNTDGAILEADALEDARGYLWREWGVRTAIKGRGPGEVRGLGSYAVGELVSKTTHSGRPKDNLLAYSPELAASMKRHRAESLRM